MAKKRVSYIFLLTIIIANNFALITKADTPPMFVFGDSTVDVGTNNHLPKCKAKADVMFNGIDYVYATPTGRFSNGYNTADILARLYGFKRSPPAFLYLLNTRKMFLKRNILRGVNFASGGSGILDETGEKFVQVVPFGVQVEQFTFAVQNIREILGFDAENFISRSTFLISVGSNDVFDYLGQYFPPNVTEFMPNLIQRYENHLKNLTNLGARKFAIISVPPIGCCPAARAYNDGACNKLMNIFARNFYVSVETLLRKLNSENQEIKYSLGNSYEVAMSIIDNPLTFGFKEIRKACCGNGTLNGQGGCIPTASVCDDRREFFFWDRFHPTQAAAELAALTFYGSGSRYVTPMNFSSLAQI